MYNYVRHANYRGHDNDNSQYRCDGQEFPKRQGFYRRCGGWPVLILSGHHFFPGLKDDWQHKHECIRVSHAQKPETVREGIALIAEEVRNASAG